jgi:tetratricopeptide (TPR) repeat protein
LGSFVEFSEATPVAEEKRKNRWLLNSVLILAVLGMIGVTIFPMMSIMGKVDPRSSPSPSATQTPEAQKDLLKKQAEGYALVLQREPENATALRGLLETRLALADVKGAIEPLEKLVKLNPQDSRMGVLLAQAKQQGGDLEAAAQVYRDILQKKPGELDALGGLSALLVTQKKPEAAISLLKDTLKEAPKTNQAAAGSVDTAALEILLGKVYATEKRYGEAIASFDTAAKDNPQDFQPVYYKASVLKEQGKLDEAKPLFEKAAKLAPDKYRDQINNDAKPTPSPSSTPAGPDQPSDKPPTPLGEPTTKP